MERTGSALAIAYDLKYSVPLGFFWILLAVALPIAGVVGCPFLVAQALILLKLRIFFQLALFHAAFFARRHEGFVQQDWFLFRGLGKNKL